MMLRQRRTRRELQEDRGLTQSFEAPIEGCEIGEAQPLNISKP